MKIVPYHYVSDDMNSTGATGLGVIPFLRKTLTLDTQMHVYSDHVFVKFHIEKKSQKPFMCV